MKNKKYIDYKNESVDVTQETFKSLSESNIKDNSKIENLRLLECSLTNYSTLKLKKWDKPLPNRKFIDLKALLEQLNSFIPDEDKEPFFNQYTNCIVNFMGKSNKQPEIPMIKAELDTNVSILEKNDKIKAIIINEKLPAYKTPTVIIDEYKKILTK